MMIYEFEELDGVNENEMIEFIQRVKMKYFN